MRPWLPIGLLLATACVPGARAPEPLNPVRFLLINDVYVADTLADGQGGLARVATVRNRLADQGRTIFVLAGDVLSPSVLSRYYGGLQISGGDVTMQPGVYLMKHADGLSAREIVEEGLTSSVVLRFPPELRDALAELTTQPSLRAVVLGAVARVAPAASLLVALLTYTLQVVLVAGVYIVLSSGGALEGPVDPRWLSAAVIACTLAWTTTQIVVSMRARQPIYDLGSQGAEASVR